VNDINRATAAFCARLLLPVHKSLGNRARSAFCGASVTKLLASESEVGVFCAAGSEVTLMKRWRACRTVTYAMATEHALAFCDPR